MIANKTIQIEDFEGYSYSEGFFLIFSKLGHNLSVDLIDGCREVFGDEWRGGRRLVGFSCRDLNIKNLDSFFRLVEHRLKTKSKTVLYRTQYKQCVVIKPSKFWLKNSLRQEFFSLFLRLGAIYFRTSKHSLNAAIRKYDLTRDIEPVINEFLSGKTNLSKKHRYNMIDAGGVHDFFYQYIDSLDESICLPGILEK